MALIKPFIYSVCDKEYKNRFACAFLKSARYHGHKAEIFCKEDFTVNSREDMAFFVFWRYELLPGLVRKHGAVLLVDIDSVFLRPVEIEPHYDIGMFFRNGHKEHNRTKTLGGIFYCASSGVVFADRLAGNMASADQSWYVDQEVLWSTYCQIGSKFAVKAFDQYTIDWRRRGDTAIYTAKGNAKSDALFLQAKREWERK